MQLLFMGTPEFSVPTLDRLARGPHTIVEVITRPDAPQGRGRALQPPAVKLAAERLGLPVRQVESLRDETTISHVTSLAPDLIVVVAFRILPAEMLRIPHLGAINLHAALLPKYRGPAPIQRAIMDGEDTTGVTVFFLEPTVDTGGILRQRAVAIGRDETYGELSARLSEIGAEEIAAAVDDIAAGRARPVRQNEAHATSAPKLRKEDARIDWRLPAGRIRDLMRGTTPEPGAHAFWQGAPFPILRVDPASDAPAGAPGTIVIADPKRGVAVATGDGALWLTTVQPPGRRPMEGAAWARGARPQPGDRFE